MIGRDGCGSNGDVTLSDEQIAAMTDDQRRELIWRLARPVADVIPPTLDVHRARLTRMAVMTIAAAVLIPWTVYLGMSLPGRYVARHWTLTWVGFDVILAVMFAATALLGLLRRQLVVLAAFSSGVLLLCDAWFDITTANVHDRPYSIATAVIAEIPIAVLLISGPLRLLRVTMRRIFDLQDGEPLWRAPLVIDVDPPADR